MQSGSSQPVIQVSLCISGLFELQPAEEVVECRIFFFEAGVSTGSLECITLCGCGF